MRIEKGHKGTRELNSAPAACHVEPEVSSAFSIRRQSVQPS
jgi:hypothetical protein